MSNRFRIAALLLASIAGAAVAQTAQPTDPLKGPAVKEGGVPGENRQFSDGKTKGKDRMGGEIPHRLFVQALNVLRGDSADASVRLSQDQDSKISAINDAFTSRVSAYREAHRDEAKALAQELSPEDRRKAMEFLRGIGEGKRPGGEKAKGKGKAAAPTDDMTDPKKAEDAKAKLRELYEAAPKPADTHAKVFAVLTDTQKPVFQKEINRLKKEIVDRAADRKTQRKAGAKADSKPAPSTSLNVQVPTPERP